MVFRSLAIIQSTSEMTHNSEQNQREDIFLFASPPTPVDTTISNKNELTQQDGREKKTANLV